MITRSNVKMRLQLRKTLDRRTIRKVKDNPQNCRKCLQTIYLIRDLPLEYIKNSHNSNKRINRPNRNKQYCKYSIKNKINRIRLWGSKKRHNKPGHLEIWLLKNILADMFNSSTVKLYSCFI